MLAPLSGFWVEPWPDCPLDPPLVVILVDIGAQGDRAVEYGD